MDQLHNQLLENNNSYKQWHEHRSHKIIHFLIFIMVAIVGTGTLLNVINKSDASSPRSSVRHNPFESLNFEARMNGKSELRGEEAIAALGGDINTVAAYYSLSGEGLKNGFKNDSTLNINSKGLLFHADNLLPQGGATPGDGTIINNPTATQIPDSQTFLLHSRPGATARVYLDFNGDINTSTYWSVPSTAPFSIDSDPSTFTTSERNAIKAIWLAVADDMAPYNIDVTTEDTTPPNMNQFQRVVITPTSSWRPGVSGIAYIGSFTWGGATAAYVFSDRLYNGTKYIAEIAAHELGHTLGFSHVSKYDSNCGLTESYHMGTGSGATSWAPLMGNPLYNAVTNWVNTYEIQNTSTSSGCSFEQDEHAVMINQNGFGYVADEASSSPSTAPTLSGNLSSLDQIGFLAQNDVDLYKFTTTGGDINFTVKPIQTGVSNLLGNADFRVRLLSSNQQVLSESNPASVGNAVVSKSAAPSGTYYLEIAASGYLDFTQPGGYNVSSSMGKYQILGSSVSAIDSVLPTGNITSPVSGSTLSGNWTISATASDNVGVTKVELYGATTLIGTDTTSPYNFDFSSTSMPEGTYGFYLKVYDAAGNIYTSDSVAYNINNSDSLPPTITITNPSSGQTLSGTVSFSANATDNVGVDHVDFYRGTTIIGADATYPYSISWDTTLSTNGSHNISALAYDAVGNSGSSNIVSVTINNTVTPPPDTTPPTVSITSPTSGQTIGGVVTLSANASDNEAVTYVSFYRGTTLIDTDTTAPYAVTWDTSLVANGSYTLSAKAFDAAANNAPSTSVPVTVYNAPVIDTTAPNVSIISPVNGSNLKGVKTNIKTSANDNVKVTKMEIYVDNILKITSTPNTTTATLNYTWETRNISAGSHTITFKAYDAAGNVGTSTISVNK